MSRSSIAAFAAFLLATTWTLPAAVAQAAKPQGASRPPYPPSIVIKNLTIDSERISVGNGDNWPITWADNGRQYTVYCDGKGFGGGSTPSNASRAGAARRILFSPASQPSGSARMERRSTCCTPASPRGRTSSTCKDTRWYLPKGSPELCRNGERTIGLRTFLPRWNLTVHGRSPSAAWSCSRRAFSRVAASR